MELPIDHFRLLGAGSTSDAQSVLHTLQLRIDRPPDQGFTSDTLQAREDLLRNSADLLSDSQRRLAYEADLTTLATSGDSVLPALEVPSSKEVGGLLLLLEAGQPLDCLDLAARALQPPQAPALGSGREADLALLAGLASLAGAAELRQQRRYEQAARVLRQGLQLLQRMGQLPAIRQQITDQLSGLRPYRVLDLLSRELASTAERAEGLALLQELVQERGGLEGSAGVGLPAADFQPFFQQIRSYLTVQEQVDLFSRWAEGSPAANLLAVFALTASGFVQRKPERIQEALERLEPGEEEATRPWRACLQLLLGEVPAALASFQAAADQPLRRRQEQPGDDPLARLCASCREWLSREVLPGYRDLEAEADLEAYFADRDVQDWVERHDGEGARAPSSDRSAPVGPAEADPFAAWFSSLADPAGSAAGLPPPASAPSAAGPAGAGPVPDPDGNPGAPWRERAGRAALACRSLVRLPARISRPWRAVGLGLGILLVVAVALRLTRPAPIALPVQPTAPPPPRPCPSRWRRPARPSCERFWRPGWPPRPGCSPAASPTRPSPASPPRSRGSVCAWSAPRIRPPAPPRRSSPRWRASASRSAMTAASPPSRSCATPSSASTPPAGPAVSPSSFSSATATCSPAAPTASGGWRASAGPDPPGRHPPLFTMAASAPGPT